MKAKRSKPNLPADADNLPSRPSTEEAVDHGVQETFPASDPVAVGSAVHKAKKDEVKETDIKPKRRPSPDWMLRPPR